MKQYPANIVNHSNETVIKIVQSEIKDETKRFKCKDGNTYIRRPWLFNSILDAFDIKYPSIKRVTTEDNKEVWGTLIEECNDTIISLIKKLPLK